MITCPKCNAPENALRWQFWQGSTFRCTLCDCVFTKQNDEIECLPLELESPFMFNENLLTKKEEPLIDVFNETHAVKIYVEVLADIKNEMRLKVTKNQIEIAARDFCKLIDLSAYNIEPEKTYYRCNSHVLEIVLPKKEKIEILVAV